MDLRAKKFVALHVLTLITLHTISRIREQRKYWVHPLWRSRNEVGAYNTLVKALLEEDELYFVKYMRMKPSEFNILKQLVRPYIKKYPAGRKALTVGHRLAITLRFLASGDSMASISFAYRIGFSTAQKVIIETCQALWTALSPKYLPSPTAEMWKRIESEYSEVWNFPNCIGAVDGKHVNMQAPDNSGSLYFNYKGQFSTVLMALVDAKYKFVVVDVGSFGSNSDGGIWKNSRFGSAFDRGQIDIPPPKVLPGTSKVMPHVLVGDEAFQLRTNFMRPYPGRQLNNQRRIYNYRLSRARRCSENVFGICVNRWRVLRNELNLKPQNCDHVVKACIVLHNFLMTQAEASSSSAYCPPSYADRVLPNGEIVEGRWREEGVPNLPLASSTTTAEVENIRDGFCEYFNNEGAVEFQYINAGLI